MKIYMLCYAEGGGGEVHYLHAFSSLEKAKEHNSQRSEMKAMAGNAVIVYQLDNVEVESEWIDLEESAL